jgi:hypothetical protein
MKTYQKIVLLAGVLGMLVLLWGNIFANIDRVADLEAQIKVYNDKVSKISFEEWYQQYRTPREPECDGLYISRGKPEWQGGAGVEYSCLDYGVAIHTILNHIGYEFKYIENEPAHHVFVPKEGK